MYFSVGRQFKIESKSRKPLTRAHNLDNGRVASQVGYASQPPKQSPPHMGYYAKYCPVA